MAVIGGSVEQDPTAYYGIENWDKPIMGGQVERNISGRTNAENRARD